MTQQNVPDWYKRWWEGASGQPYPETPPTQQPTQSVGGYPYPTGEVIAKPAEKPKPVESPPARTPEEKVAQKVAQQQEEKTGMPAEITYARLTNQPGWRENEANWRAANLGLSQEEFNRMVQQGGYSYALSQTKNIKYQREQEAIRQAAIEKAVKEQKDKTLKELGLPPDTETITIARDTRQPQEIWLTPDIKQLRKDDRYLFGVLTSRGLSAYKEAVNQRVGALEFAEKSEVKRIQKLETKFRENNIELTDGNWIANEDLKTIKEADPEAYKILIADGYDAYDKFVSEKDAKFKRSNTQLPDGSWMDNTDLLGIEHGQPELYKVLMSDGYDAYASRVAEINKKAESWEKLPLHKKIWQGLTPWDESAGERGTPKGAATMAAEVIVPGVYAARHWKDMSPSEKTLAISIDVVTLLPFIGAAAKGAKTVGTAGRLTRLTAAGKGVLREALAQVRAPIDMVIHPVGAVKTTAREVRNLVENIAHPRKIPEAVITTTDGTVRLLVSETTSPEQAMLIRDTLMELAARGEKPIVKIGNQTVELSVSPLMKEMRGGLVHTTPMGEEFEKGLKVAWKEGMPPPEQGLFLSNEPLPKFGGASAFGKKGEKPAIIITSKEMAAKAVPSQKIYRGTVEMEMKLPTGTELGAPQQKLFTRVGPMGMRYEINLGKKLTPKQIIKLKSLSLVENIVTPFKPAIKVSGKGEFVSLTKEQVKKLSSILNQSGNIDQAENLLRAERLTRAVRSAPRPLTRIAGRTGISAIRNDLKRIRNTIENPRISNLPTRNVIRLASPTIRARIARVPVDTIRIENIGRVERAGQGERTELSERAEDRVVREERVERAGERVERIERITPRPPREGPPREGPPRERPPREGPPRERPPREEPPREEPPREEPPRIRLPKGATDQEKRQYIKKAGGAIAFRMGELNKKDVWHVLTHPYQSGEDHITVLGRKPAGATIVRGARSAYKTAKLLYGTTPSKKILMDLGIQDIEIEPISEGKGISIGFKADPKLTTTGDITISKRGTRLENKGRVFPLAKQKIAEV